MPPLSLPRYALTVYVLRDPRDGRVRYVGQTGGSVPGALRAHLTHGRRVISGRVTAPTPVAAWVGELIAAGLRPIAGAIDYTPRRDRWYGGSGIECWWIHEYRRREPDLLNRTFFRKNVRHLGRFAALAQSAP